MVRKGYEGFYWVRGNLETEQNYNILTPTLMAITTFLSVLLGCSTRGLGPQPFWDMVPIPASSLQLIWTPTDLNLLSPGLYNNLTPTLLPASVIISPSIQPHESHGRPWSPEIFDRMHLLFTQVHFFFWQIGRVGGQYATIVIFRTQLYDYIELIILVNNYSFKETILITNKFQFIWHSRVRYGQRLIDHMEHIWII